MGTISSQWHTSRPKMKVTGSCNYTISGTTISVTGNIRNALMYSGSHYGYSLYASIQIDGVEVASVSSHMEPFWKLLRKS